MVELMGDRRCAAARRLQADRRTPHPAQLAELADQFPDRRSRAPRDGWWLLHARRRHRAPRLFHPAHGDLERGGRTRRRGDAGRRDLWLRFLHFATVSRTRDKPACDSCCAETGSCPGRHPRMTEFDPDEESRPRRRLRLNAADSPGLRAGRHRPRRRPAATCSIASIPTMTA